MSRLYLVFAVTLFATAYQQCVGLQQVVRDHELAQQMGSAESPGAAAPSSPSAVCLNTEQNRLTHIAETILELM